MCLGQLEFCKRLASTPYCENRRARTTRAVRHLEYSCNNICTSFLNLGRNCARLLPLLKLVAEQAQVFGKKGVSPVGGACLKRSFPKNLDMHAVS